MCLLAVQKCFIKARTEVHTHVFSCSANSIDLHTSQFKKAPNTSAKTWKAGKETEPNAKAAMVLLREF